MTIYYFITRLSTGEQAPPLLEVLATDEIRRATINKRRKELCSAGGHIYQRQGTGRGFQRHVVVIGKHSQDASRKGDLSPVSAR